jgi:predicted patatin/cPLA2 family phospholipase
MEMLGDNLLNATIGHPLVDRLRLKRELLEHGDPSHAEIKTALIIDGGGMRGVYAGGVVTGLQAVGMQETFDDVVGISAGACAGGYLLAGQAALGTSIYYEDLTSREFINLRRYKNIMNIGYLERIMRTTKALDVATIEKSRSHLRVGVTKVKDGSGHYIDVAAQPKLDVVRTIIASSSLPGITKETVVIDGVAYSDGLSGCHDPIGYAINELGATDILVVLNRPITGKRSVPAAEKLLHRLVLRGFSKAFQEAHINRYAQDGFAATNSYNPIINIGVLCPESASFSQLSTNEAKLRAAAIAAERQTIALLG